MKKVILFLCLLLWASLMFGEHVKAKTTPKILFLGDSLTEGYGVDETKAYPVLVGRELQVEVLNGSVSGSTTASGPSRLKWFLKAKPTHMLLSLGANDGLRGLNLKDTKKNLEAIIKLAQENSIRVVLAGMLMPPNYGKDYRSEFHSMYQGLTKEYKLDFIPFLLEGVAGNPKLNISDGIHPNEEGHAIIAKLVAKKFKGIL